MVYFKLNDLLKQHKYSRNQFAQISGVRPNTINDMCNGNTKRLEIETLTLILKALNEISDRPIDICDVMSFIGEVKN